MRTPIVKAAQTTLFLIAVLLISSCTSEAKITSFQTTLPAAIAELSSGYVICVDKQLQKLFVFHRDGSTIEKVYEAPCSTGKRQGEKMLPGDAKTPEGIFFASRLYSDRNLATIYGTRAYRLDYPNPLDRKVGRDGNNIWIHGTNKPLKPYQSNGCIALRNEDIERLAPMLQLNKTPVVIEKTIRWVSLEQSSTLKNELNEVLAHWLQTHNDKETGASPSVRHFRHRGGKSSITGGSARRVWTDHFSLAPRDVTILIKDNTAVILYDQILAVSDDGTFRGAYRKLYLEKRNGTWFALGDREPTILAAAAMQEPVVTPPANQAPVRTAAPRKAPPEAKQSSAPTANMEVRGALDRWLAAWEKGDMKGYRSCYLSNFASRGMDLDAWVAYKSDLYEKYREINIRIEKIKISIDKDRANVTFTQKYTAPGIKLIGRKSLELRKVEGGWKIAKEMSSI
ncbi:MAG: L,D-transpeptidase family protein [Smithellaceae bacterium]|nr:L,D-transpeptidase family protein [Smithellaceae bacterium]